MLFRNSFFFSIPRHPSSLLEVFFSIDVWNLSRETTESSRVFVFHRTHLLKEPYTFIYVFSFHLAPLGLRRFPVSVGFPLSVYTPKHLHRVVASTTSFGQTTWPALRRQRATHGGRRIPVACGESDLSARRGWEWVSPMASGMTWEV